MIIQCQNHHSVALITGSAKRLGATIAKILHSAGFRVIIHYRHSKTDAVTLRDSLNRKRTNSAAIVQADLDDQTIYHRLVHDAYQIWNRLDLLVNNASAFIKTPVGTVNFSHWDQLFNSNLKAPFFISQAAMPFLKEHNGSIVNITDIHAEKPMKNYSVYSIAKAGLRMMTKALALECAPIRVNAIAPGSVLWPEHENILTDEEKKHVLLNTMLQKQVNPEDIANTVLFLTTQSSITAQTITIDGGRIQ